MTMKMETPIALGTQESVVLRTVGLSKSFGTLDAVKNLNLELRRGEVFGFLGPMEPGRVLLSA